VTGDLLTVAEVVEITHMGEDAVRRLIQKGSIPSVIVRAEIGRRPDGFRDGPSAAGSGHRGERLGPPL
jgi:hypothetical protein